MQSLHDQQDVFQTTHWSVISKAKNQEQSLVARSFENYCEQYWYPIMPLSDVRSARSHAEDLTQGFFYILSSQLFWISLTRQREIQEFLYWFR